MESISDVTLSSCENSMYIKPIRIKFQHNGKQRVWDAMKVHDSVSVLLFNTDRQVFVFVKQFRPAVYLSRSSVTEQNRRSVIDTEKNPAKLGITHELCAGIVDKDLSEAELASEELMEETGYKVSADCLEKITSYRTGVGVSSAHQTMFYAAVTDSQKVGPGGGNWEEGELIELAEIPLAESLKFTMDETIVKPMGLMFAIMWFHHHKLPTMDK